MGGLLWEKLLDLVMDLLLCIPDGPVHVHPHASPHRLQAPKVASQGQSQQRSSGSHRSRPAATLRLAAIGLIPATTVGLPATDAAGSQLRPAASVRSARSGSVRPCSNDAVTGLVYINIEEASYISILSFSGLLHEELPPELSLMLTQLLSLISNIKQILPY